MDWLAFSLVSNLVRKHILNLVISYLFGLTQTKQTTIQWCPQKKIFWQSHVTFSLFKFLWNFIKFYFRAALAGREGGFRKFFYYPHAAWPTLSLFPPNAGGDWKRVMLANHPTTQSASPASWKTFDLLICSYAKLRACYDPRPVNSRNAQKGNQVSKRFIKDRIMNHINLWIWCFL